MNLQTDYEYALDQSSIVAATDAKGIITYVNEKFCEISQYSREELIGHTHHLINSGYHPPEFWVHLWKTISGGSIWKGQVQNRAKDGSLYWVQTSIIPFFKGQKRPCRYLAIRTDITEYKRLEEEKKQLTEQLFQAQKMEVIGRLARGISHDFNNILGTVQPAVQSISHRSSDPKIQETCEVILESVSHAAHVVKQLLLFSKQMKQLKVLHDSRFILRDIQKMVKHTLGDHIQLVLDLCETPLWIEADTVQLQQVVLNIATNARDAMPRGGVFIIQVSPVILDSQIALRKGRVSPGRYCRITFRDTGVGIPMDQMDHVFEPFFTTKSRDKGTGLGLSVVYGIVEDHQGAIQVDSDPDVGTCFHIYLPEKTHEYAA